MFDRFVKFVASPPFALTCILTGAGLYGLVLFPLQFLGIPGDQIARLAVRGLPFLAIYVLLAASTIACFRKRLKVLPKLLATAPRLPARDSEVVSTVAFDARRAERALRRTGFRHIIVGEAMVSGVKAPWAPLGNYLLHGAILLGIIAGIIAAIPNADFIARVRVAEGDSLVGTEAALSESVAGGRRDMPSFTLQSVEGSSVGQRPGSLVVTVQPPAGRPRRITAGAPWIADPITLVAAEDFGLSYTFSVVASGTADMLGTDVLDSTSHPSNTTEYVEIMTRTGQRYRISALASSRPASADSKAPLAVSLAGTSTAPGAWALLAETPSMKVGDILKAGDVWLRLDGIRPHAVLRVHRSPAAPFALVAIACAALGSFMRLAIPRTEAVLERTPSGDTAIRTAADVHRGASGLHVRIMRAWEATE